ncbi:MAG: helix-turn-helix transcriptional regulator [Lachnospiraceae bacterium]|nr:helix-turn-helix transcriptional regulator [Lachnospiraceae bacterium]
MSFSLREIAQKCGFQNYNYFLTVFKNTTGVTPMQYRTDHKFCPGVI